MSGFDEPGRQYRKADPGRGFVKGEMRRIVVSFDEETFEQVRRRARAAKTSFAEQVRLLTEWGLEADTDSTGAQ